MFTDLRQSLRSLGRSPFLCTMAILTLALGIGINTAMFSIIDTTLLRGMPMREEERVLRIGLHDDGDDLSEPTFRALQQRLTSFSALATYADRSFTFSDANGDPERITGTYITAPGLAILEAPLAFGRWHTPAEDAPGAPAVVVLSHALWKNRYQSDPGILGRQIRIDDEACTVIGVAAAGFRFPHSQECWLSPRGAFLKSPAEDRLHNVIGRLKPGVTLEQARAELAALIPQLQREQPGVKDPWTVRLRPLSKSYDDDPSILWVMLGAVCFVLLIACVNVANLLLARAVVRSRELAVRSALGAGRGQLVRLLLGEAAVLAVAGALAGWGVAQLCMLGFQQAIVHAAAPYWMQFGLDARALAYTGGLAVASCLLAGLIPAWRLSRPELNAVLNDGSRGATSARVSRLTRAMVVGQIAFSCALLVVSALMIRSVLKMQSAPLGFQPEGVFTGRIGLPPRDYPSNEARAAFYERALADLRARPEVAEVGLCTSQPVWHVPQAIALDGAPAPAPNTRGPVAVVREVSSGFLPALQVALFEGRGLADSDRAGAPAVALVSRSFVERHWPGQSALGRRVRLGSGASERWVTVVGVVADTMQGRFEISPQPQIYVSYLQLPELQRVTFFVRARGVEEAALAPVIRAALRAQHAQVPLYYAMPFRQMLLEAMFTRKLFAGLFGVFGGAAFLLAMVGLYGVMSYGVAQRRQEMGLRLALGATARDLVKLIVRQGAWQLAFGLALGIALAAGGAQLLAAQLYGVRALDPLSFVATVVALGAAGLIASLLPGLRASRTDPAEALRGQ
ncbi:MAG: ABC transporter permease [Verrucomicrobia bacterium]|nr:ABC transporter permease [Verrucomicrobiota bacterium]